MPTKVKVMRLYCPQCGRIVPGVHPYQISGEHREMIRRVDGDGIAAIAPCGGRFELYNPRRKPPDPKDDGKVKPRTEAKIC